MQWHPSSKRYFIFSNTYTTLPQFYNSLKNNETFKWRIVERGTEMCTTRKGNCHKEGERRTGLLHPKSELRGKVAASLCTHSLREAGGIPEWLEGVLHSSREYTGLWRTELYVANVKNRVQFGGPSWQQAQRHPGSANPAKSHDNLSTPRATPLIPSKLSVPWNICSFAHTICALALWDHTSPVLTPATPDMESFRVEKSPKLQALTWHCQLQH